MPLFTPLFFEPLKIELNDAEKYQLDSVLFEIYNGSPINYKTSADFNECKNQLLALLDFIRTIDESRLALFTRYRENVSKLLDSSPLLDIEVTLKAAKQILESSLLAIIENHARVDKTALDSLVVEKCYSGAFSSIDYALGYFQVNALAFYVNTTKSQLLLELCQRFLLENKLLECVGNDTHYANGLYNIFAPKYGVSLKEDPLSHEFPLDIPPLFSDYLDKKFTIASFIQFLATLLPMPPQEKIENSEQLKALATFFEIFEKEGLVKEKYLRLYDEDESGIVLMPKPEFELFFTALLATYLEEKGYLNDLHYRLEGKTFLYTGNALVSVNENGSFRVLPDKEFLLPQIASLLDSLSLWSQITAETLVALFQESSTPEDKKRYFTALLTKPVLPLPILNTLLITFMIKDDFRTELSELANYIFTNLHYEETLQFIPLAKFLTADKKDACIINLTKLDRAFYVRGFLLQDPVLLHNCGKKLPSIAAIYGATNVIAALDDLEISLTEFDEHGLSPACYAAVWEKTAVLGLLDRLGVDLDEGNQEGKTPAHFAAMMGKITSISMLHDLKADLTIGDINNSTPFHYAAQQGNVEVLLKLHELGIALNEPDAFGWTPAFYAKVNSKVAFTEKLEELGVIRKSKPVSSFSLFGKKDEDVAPQTVAGQVSHHK